MKRDTRREPTKMTDNKIPVLWFDARGCAPDEFALELHPFPADMGGRIPACSAMRSCRAFDAAR